MTFPEAPGSDPASRAQMACAEAGCERPVVDPAVYCRVHLVEALRAEGEAIPFRDPEFAGWLAAAIQIVRSSLDGLPQGVLDGGGPVWGIDMYAFVDPDSDWPIAQMALDVLGTHLTDTPPFAGMTLSPPMKYDSWVLLRLQVGVPTSAVDELRPRLEFALEAMVREILGSDVPARFAAEPAEGSVAHDA
jgi:hypothetical protein